jgi:Predicted dehydrogenases and related proteins
MGKFTYLAVRLFNLLIQWFKSSNHALRIQLGPSCRLFAEFIFHIIHRRAPDLRSYAHPISLFFFFFFSYAQSNYIPWEPQSILTRYLRTRRSVVVTHSYPDDYTWPFVLLTSANTDSYKLDPPTSSQGPVRLGAYWPHKACTPQKSWSFSLGSCPGHRRHLCSSEHPLFLACAAFHAHKYVLVEKSLIPTSAEALRLAAPARAKGKILCISEPIMGLRLPNSKNK